MLDGGDEKGGGPESASGGGGSSVAGGGGEFYEGDRSTGGNRWPRQETLALLKIRSDMDTAFRDSSLKGPLWEEISRKMAELGYHRSGKKCKEKFENVYKYHKRTKEGRVAKADGKTYRFFDQLEAFDHHQHHHSQPQLPPDEEAVPVTMLMPASAIPHHVTVTSTPPINIIHHYQNQQQQQQQQKINTNNNNNPITNQTQQPAMPMSSSRSASATPSSSSSTDVDEEVAAGTRKRKRSRKWKGLLKRMAREVIHKQEELQRRFMEAVEKQEKDRITREEAWRVQELSRLKREHDTLVHERSMAAAKDGALISFLQKIAEQRNIPFPLSLQAQAQPQAQIQIQIQAQAQAQAPPKTKGATQKEEATPGARWPKAEVEALIKLRSSMDSKYEENNPKGPLWEEISAAMKKMGYNRSSKRCKEKWENINKYFKKVKESNRKRRDDSKTCPYFDHLDALYQLKNQPPTEVGRAEAHPAQESEDFEDDDEEEGDEEGGGFEIVANTTAAGGGGTTAAEEGGERR